MHSFRFFLIATMLVCASTVYADTFSSEISPLLKKHCVRCHGVELQEGNLRVDRLNQDFIKGEDADRWHEVLNRLNVGEMPPEDEPQPTIEELEVLTGWLTGELKKAAIARRANGGQIVLRRLNRREYGNTLRDLFGVPLQFEQPLPPDGPSGDGYLNNGETLSMSPLHFDYYLKIARLAISKAIPSGEQPRTTAWRLEVTRGKENPKQKKRKNQGPTLSLEASFLDNHNAGSSAGRPPVSASFGRRGDRAQANEQGAVLTPGLRARGTGIPGRQTPNPSLVFRCSEFPTEGHVRVRVTAGNLDPDSEVRPQVRVFVGTLLDDGTEFAFLGPGQLVTHSADAPGVYEFNGRLEELPLPFRSRIQNNSGDLNVMMFGVINSVDAEVDQEETPRLQVSRVDFEAPVHDEWPTPAWRQVFFDGSPEPGTEFAYARKIFRRFMTRAWRRPVTTRELDRVHSIWQRIWNEDVVDVIRDVEVVPEPEPGKPGLKVAYFDSTPQNASVEAMEEMTSAADGVAEQIGLNVPLTTKKDDYALQFSGIVNVPTDGDWKLRLTSDDGSRLYLDGELLIDNDGNHGMVEKVGEIPLSAGPHSLLVNYFNSQGGQGLRVEWEGPGVERGPIDSAYLTHGGSLPVPRPPIPTFESTVKAVLPAILASSGFLYLAESKHADPQLTDFELASRLSYFLWSTMPDEELFDLAENGQLTQPDVLRHQVGRMLTDERSQEFIRNFVDQWLDLDGVHRVAINKDRYKDLWDETKDAMQNETRSFFAELLHHDLSALNLIDSGFTVLNDHLAEHYRISGVSGPDFRRVALKEDDERGGLLTHGSVLYGGSDGKDSHPVRRGVWLLKKLLDDPPPDPPPNVPDLNQEDPKLSGLPLKKQLEVHRSNQACANCHRKIDPWGIAFEDYSAVGRWRGRKGDLGYAQDAAASTLPDGTEIGSLRDLKAYLLKERQADFARALTKNLMTYALGRSLDFSDGAMIETMSEQFQKNDFRIRWLIEEIVVSEAFRNR